MYCFFLLIPVLSFSQVKPSKDSVKVSVNSIKEANKKFIELDECEEEKDSIFSALRTAQGAINNYKASIDDLQRTNKGSEFIISDKQAIINLSDLQLKKDVRRIKWLRLERNTFLGVAGILALKIFISK